MCLSFVGKNKSLEHFSRGCMEIWRCREAWFVLIFKPIIFFFSTDDLFRDFSRIDIISRCSPRIIHNRAMVVNLNYLFLVAPYPARPIKQVFTIIILNYCTKTLIKIRRFVCQFKFKKNKRTQIAVETVGPFHTFSWLVLNFRYDRIWTSFCLFESKKKKIWYYTRIWFGVQCRVTRCRWFFDKLRNLDCENSETVTFKWKKISWKNGKSV